MRSIKYLNHDNPIIIYGAAAIGVLAFEVFNNSGFQVEGFIDKRANEIQEFCDKPVWRDEDAVLSKFKENGIVFVAIKNVFEHQKIAARLRKLGFENIIFRASSVINGGGTKKEIELNELYESIINNRININMEIPYLYDISIFTNKDISVIRSKDSRVIVMVPVTLVFTDKRHKQKEIWTENNQNKSLIWLNRNILSLVPHIQLFNFIGGDLSADYNYYIDFCIEAAELIGRFEITDRWKKNVIKNRTEIYEHMNMSLEVDRDFFVRNAPIAEWNSNGYFNLKSGKHRAAFLASKKLKFIPLSISKEDYNKWINIEKVKEIQKKFEALGTTELKAPIPHPYFYQISYGYNDFYYNFIYKLATDFFTKTFISDKRLDLSKVNMYFDINDLDFIERYFSTAGCNVFCPMKSIGLIEEIDELMYYKPHNVDIKQNQFYDLIVLDEDSELLQGNKFLKLKFGRMFIIHTDNIFDKSNITKINIEINYIKYFHSIAGGKIFTVLEVLKKNDKT